MLDDLEFDSEKYPGTRYVANLLLTTGPSYRWCLDFFYRAREAMDSGKLKEEDVLQKIKEIISANLPQEGLFRVGTDKVDWTALYNFIKEKTKPTIDGV